MSTTLPGLLAQRAAGHPDRIALREKEFGIWQEITWAGFLARVRSFALGLVELGMEKGDRIAIIGDNRPEWVIAELGAQAIGALPLGLYQDSISAELARMLQAADARVIVAEDQEQVDKVLEVRDRVPGLEHIIYYDPRGMYGYEAPGLMAFEEVEALGDGFFDRFPMEFDKRLAAIRSADTALLCTTSGTTSVPKLAMLSHANLLAMAEQLVEVDPMRPGDEFVSFLPLAWIGEQMVGVASALKAGFTVNFPEETATVRSDIREIGPAFMMSPPRIWENMVSDVQVMAEDTSPVKRLMYRWAMREGMRAAGERAGLPARVRHRLADWTVFQPIRDQLGLSRVRRAYTGGAALGPDVFRFFHAIGVNLKQLYGQTEVSGISVVHRDGDIRFHTVGRPFPQTEIRISDDGEILCRSPAVFQGYFRNPDATAEALADGWLHSGDAGYFEDDGHLVVIDRLADVMKLPDDTTFSPQFVENKLKFSPYVREAVVFGGGGAPFVTAMIAIDMENAGQWAERHRIPYTTFTDLARREEVYGPRPRPRRHHQLRPAPRRPHPPLPAAAQGAARRRRRAHPHAQGAPPPHRRALRRHHRGAGRGWRFGHGRHRDHVPGRAHRRGRARTAHRDDGLRRWPANARGPAAGPPTPAPPPPTPARAPPTEATDPWPTSSSSRSPG